MPLFPEGQDPLDQTQGAPLNWPSGPPSGLVPVPTPTKVLGAAFRQTNSLSTVYSWLTKKSPDATPVPGYDPIPRVVGTHYEQYAYKFEGDVNPAQTDARMAQIDRDLQDQRWLAASHADGTAAIVVAIAANPLWILPIWVALRLWKQQAASASAKADLISKEMKKDSFRLLVFVIVSLRKAWRCVISSLRLAYGRVRDAVHDDENTQQAHLGGQL
jgi:hypothetical protein